MFHFDATPPSLGPAIEAAGQSWARDVPSYFLDDEDLDAIRYQAIQTGLEFVANIATIFADWLLYCIILAGTTSCNPKIALRSSIGFWIE